MIALRDTKNRADGMLTFRADEWPAFLTGVKHGAFGTLYLLRPSPCCLPAVAPPELFSPHGRLALNAGCPR
ncbi:DUF397 domain-containing protein [Spongiactinospora rosea]